MSQKHSSQMLLRGTTDTSQPCACVLACSSSPPSSRMLQCRASSTLVSRKRKRKDTGKGRVSSASTTDQDAPILVYSGNQDQAASQRQSLQSFTRAVPLPPPDSSAPQ
ncbi:uncharacterized protein SEPMUDRAFT_107234 [Sphaerulina musiva SO2202]|uniref:Uncharacterized protein n=1 Tax=Sphaerulina musiva (strain SO2202) TaxID=692275 RepID=M3B064_SPHMS|nr:uncharacterized protein SEPMUDRAFT_107234 [Sphaerulina musiva SO2202]EMF13182.1 hypothetical protein SEPMUDRAFT_107234 [Sphaerulina musiva SO2202]